MKLPPLTIACSLFPSLFLFGETVSTTLEITPEPEFNSIEITIAPPVLPLSGDNTNLSGSLEVELEIDPDSDQVSALTIINGTASGTPLSLSASNFLGSYDFSSTEIGAGVETLTPPGAVDPTTGEFDASEHSFTVQSGTLFGSISIPLLDIDEIVDFDFATEPFGGVGEGTGTVALTPTGITTTSKSYDVVILFPVQIEPSMPWDLRFRSPRLGLSRGLAPFWYPSLRQIHTLLGPNPTALRASCSLGMRTRTASPMACSGRSDSMPPQPLSPRCCSRWARWLPRLTSR